jgi:hypothetical protein
VNSTYSACTVYVLLLYVTTISTVHLQPACSLHSLLSPQSSTPTARTRTSCASLLQYLSTWIICTQYSLRLLHTIIISTVHLQPACSLLQRPVIDLYKVETNARLHFTHQTETSLYFYSYISGTFSPFSYSYISPTGMQFVRIFVTTTTVPVYKNHLHPVQSTVFYFMWQRFLQHIYSQHAAPTVFYASSMSMPMFTATSMLIWAPLSTPILRLRPSMPLLFTSSATRHWPIMVETSARLHFTHQTETSPFVYIYIWRTFSWLFQRNWQRSEPSDHSLIAHKHLLLQLHFANISTLLLQIHFAYIFVTITIEKTI